MLEAPLEKKAGINYGPPGTKHLVYFVDDLNMPKLDPYETAMPISLIRQHLSWGHWFGETTYSRVCLINWKWALPQNAVIGCHHDHFCMSYHGAGMYKQSFGGFKCLQPCASQLMALDAQPDFT